MERTAGKQDGQHSRRRRTAVKRTLPARPEPGGSVVALCKREVDCEGAGDGERKRKRKRVRDEFHKPTRCMLVF